MKNNIINFSLPSSWSEITIDQYKNIDFTDSMHMISVLSGQSYETIKQFNEKDLIRIIKHLVFLTEEPSGTLVNNVKGFNLIKDVSDLNIGQLELIERLCLDFKGNADLIMAFLYPCEDLNNKNIKVHAQIFKDCNVVDLFMASAYILATSGYLVIGREISQQNKELVK